jgi:ATPase subunit of ABC transporter with duplicated ATPase domains
MKWREDEARRREEEANRATEQMRQFLEETRKREEELRQRGEEARRREDLARQLAEENKRDEQEARQREAEAQAREEESKRQEEEARKAAIKAQEEEERAKKNLEQTNVWLSIGIQPVYWPSKEEFNLAQARIEYNSQKVHLAICGSSGAGKSSLINAFRGFANHEPGAAPAGVVETTVAIDRYPDARAEFPHSHFVWFDVPGAGTLDIPGWQYFNNQGLFIFDVIVLVYDTVSPSLDTRCLG